jgi:hypothetical protein
MPLDLNIGAFGGQSVDVDANATAVPIIFIRILTNTNRSDTSGLQPRREVERVW